MTSRFKLLHFAFGVQFVVNNQRRNSQGGGGGGGDKTKSSVLQKQNMRSLRLFLFIIQVSLAFQAQTVRNRPGNWFRPSSVVQSSAGSSDVGSKSTNIVPPTTTSTNPPVLSNERVQRLQRSSAVVAATAATWFLGQQSSISIVQASSLVGLVGCFCTSLPAMTAAIFCGSFAGMSAQVQSLVGVAGLGSFAAAVYYLWDAKKVGVGKGGRLGTIAFLGNLLFHAVMAMKEKQGLSVVQQSLGILGKKNAVGLAIAGTALCWSRRANIVNKKRQSVATSLSKLGVLTSVALSANGVVPLQEYILTTLAIYISSLAVKESDGIVLPVALLGLLGSFTSYAAPIYLGAFLGMTGLATFGTFNFAQASLFSSLLFKLGLWNGFGGKLGLQAFLGVLFGM